MTNSVILIDIEKNWKAVYIKNKKIVNYQCFFIEPITPLYILKLLNFTKSSNVLAVYGTSISLFKKCYCSLIDILSYLFNKIMLDRYFSEELKILV